MICPNCASEKTRVIGTVKGLITKRFRNCLECNYGFSTKEIVDDNKLAKEYNDYLQEIDILPKKLRHKAQQSHITF
ncbi:MAG: hypothetical protein IE881_03195 [Epsilonproteobacteria bacterium]|nr:hypothetical protein [Campylobacterota bacterium]